jgi:hypothetical protein
MSLARLALQVGLIFCICGAAAGIAAELSIETIIWRSLLCAGLGAGLGAALGALIRWLFHLGQDSLAMPVDGEPLSSEALTTGEADGHGG